MTKQDKIQLFEERKVRTLWDDEAEKWYISVIDAIEVLTDSNEPKRYWSDLKRKLKKEGNETYENIVRLKMRATDGKMRMTDVADTEQLFRLIQSIPSPKAEPFKLWMAEVASERLDQMQDPERSIEQAMTDYRRLGYSESWINQRIKSIEIRKELTDEPTTNREQSSSLELPRCEGGRRSQWKRQGLEEGVQFATLTDIIYKTWSDHSAKEYKRLKNLKKENLRDNMTNAELVLNMLAELSTKGISEATDPQTMTQHADVAKQGGEVARNARMELEAKTGKKVVTSLNASSIEKELEE